MQLITYSGHAPFILPKQLREVSFSSGIPEKMGDYMTTARYTDKAIGKFVEYLKTLPQYKETLIVMRKPRRQRYCIRQTFYSFHRCQFSCKHAL